MLQNQDRRFKLGMHSYTLHLSGFGESWGFQEYGEHHTFEQVKTFEDLVDIAVEVGLDVLHITLVDIQNDISAEHLAACRRYAEEHGIELELNVSFHAPSDPRVNCTIEDSLEIAHTLGCKLVKYSTDVKHPEKSSHSCMCASVVAQLAAIAENFRKAIPLIEKYGLQISIENHCDLFSDEVIWLVEELAHPQIGACCDTINSLMLMEGIESCVRKMAPYVNCVHFCDNRVFADPDGTHSVGTAIGQGNVDCAAIIKILREQAPKQLDTIDLEIELPLSGYSIEEGRKLELKGLRESCEYMYKTLGVGYNAANIYNH
ncbi:sugar phosphate isomerase/epimerase family protein [Wansuia hejianensis]|uniref:Sugar phosphate isomerase/epimerase n=1 Tax=Wansuia hejianensis TaxID=2763667 RepID=A0A7G9GB99_9FIRM|nr:TIM barrel protein [Wansuia hejianensis]QNM08081.1 sugar phosphate isomerase/epimerase [Wansuia hejianensis]